MTTTTASAMVECSPLDCGQLLPEAEALPGSDGSMFCSEECRDRAEGPEA